MAPRSLLRIATLLSLGCYGVQAARFPPKIYGVNLGSWLLIEPWMLPNEWIAMGGQACDDCSTCIASEFEFAKAYPNTVDQKMNEHWNTWFTGQDAATLRENGINTVRIPLGYWIVEDLVDRRTEFFARGGLKQLRRGLRQLHDNGIVAILDHHALPGAQATQQQFAGRCTRDPQFYTPYNYHRALIWTAVMTTLTHIDPAFENVVSIHAVNEPHMDASHTPGYGDFQKNFVQVVRAVEFGLGMPIPGQDRSPIVGPSGLNITSALAQVTQLRDIFNDEVRSVLRDAQPIITKLIIELGLPNLIRAILDRDREPIVTNFMDINWQWNNPPNPADAAIGPQNYDNHLYYSFGGVADPNEEAYLRHLCNLDRIEKDAALGNTPLFFGEWSLATQFSASDAFLRRWADAQKLQYSKDAGWIFWNFKIEPTAGTARQWSYYEGLRRGYLTKDPSQYHDPHVCDAYVRN
ncbi:hypothetical protein AX16_004632 [Volvariella volvacea WC 439]|nr:hypothetical protein AX16_004632 [Volvariella volvacea WC 439]